MVETLNQKGVSNWLTNLPIKELGYELTKKGFWDAIKIRSNWIQEDRLDISGLNSWTTGQRASFDVRVFNLFAQRRSKLAVEKCFRANENEKKKSYGNRVFQIKNGSFTPLVFAANGGMGKECIRFY